jgi:hypothetical protein
LKRIRLANGEAIIPENLEEINKSVIKTELNVITLRNMIEQYQTFYRTICDPENVNNQKYTKIMEVDYSIQRFRAGLISNIKGALVILDQNDIHTDIVDSIRSNVTNYDDKLYFDESIKIDDKKMLEVQSLAGNIINKPYQDWMYKEKTKIRQIFTEDAKKTWNSIKQPAGQATKIAPDLFTIH